MSRITKSAKDWCRPVALGVGLALWVALSWAPRAEAQVLYGSIVGAVTDQSQAAVPGAKITITHQQTNLSRETTTNEAGTYTFSTVPTGTYTLKVTMQGFRELVQSGVEVATNDVKRVDLTLQLGGVSEVVEVNARPPELQTDRAEVREELPARQLENLPVPQGRNYQYLLGTLPGVTPPISGLTHTASPSRSLRFEVNGVSGRINNTRIDGASATHIWLPDGVAYSPNLESIETVNVVTNSFDAEQGLAGGAAVNVIIKSGTNNLHGSAFWFHNDNAIKAKPTFLPAGQRQPKDIYNQWGASLGGPIKRDKLFFFSSYEGTSENRRPGTFVTVPTLGMRTGDMSASPNPVYDPLTGNSDGSGRTPFPGNIIPADRFDPVIKKILPLVPLPTFDRLTNNLFVTAPFFFDRLRWDNKFNWNPSQKLTMFGRWSWLDFKSLNSEVFGPLSGRPVRRDPEGDPGRGHGGTYATSIGATYVFSPTFVVDGNFGWTKLLTDIQQGRIDEKVGLDVLGIPGTNGPRWFEGGTPRFMPGWTGIQSSNFTEYGVCCPFMPAHWRDPQYQYQANATWTKGTHNIRFGFDFYRQHMNQIQPEIPGVAFHGASGGFGFTGGPTALRGGASPNMFNEYATFLLGLSTNTGKINLVPDNGITTRARLYSFYVRDQWQVTPKLTFSYGTRWEHFPIPTRADRGVERYDFRTNKMLVCGVGSVPTDCGVEVSNRQFAPRVGVAYRVTPTFVIRSGYGLNWDPFNIAVNLRQAYPITIALNLQGANSFLWATRVRDGIPAIPVPDLGNGILDAPLNVAFNTMGDRLERGYIQSWNFTLEKQLRGGFTGQIGYVATRMNNQLGTLDLNTGLPGGGVASMPLFQKYGRGVATRLVAPVENTHYDSLQATLQRRFARGLSLNMAYTFSKVIGSAPGTGSEQSFNSGAPPIKLPQFYQLNRSVAPINMPHNLQVVSVAELPFGRSKSWLKDGVAAAIAGGWQVNGIFSAFSGLPFSVAASDVSLNAPGNTPQRADQVKPDVKILGGTGPGQSWFDPLAFAPVRDARFGTAGYNSLYGPGTVNLDFGLFRKFQLRERLGMEFRAEVFNLTNTPHFANPGLNVSSMTLNADGTVRSLGGYTEITGTKRNGRDNIDERLFRLGLRFTW